MSKICIHLCHGNNFGLRLEKSKYPILITVNLEFFMIGLKKTYLPH